MTSLNNILQFFHSQSKTLQILSGVYTSKEGVRIEPGDIINVYSGGVRLYISPVGTAEQKNAWTSDKQMNRIFVAKSVGLLLRTSYTSLSSLVKNKPKYIHGICGGKEKDTIEMDNTGDLFFDCDAKEFAPKPSNPRTTLEDREVTDIENDLVFYSDDIVNGRVPLPITMSFADMEVRKTFEMETGLKEFIVTKGKPSVCLAIKIGKAIENVNRGMAVIRGVQCLNFGAEKLKEIKANIVENLTLKQIVAQYATSADFDQHGFKKYDLYVKIDRKTTTNEAESLYIQMKAPTPKGYDDSKTCSITDFKCSLHSARKSTGRCSETSVESIYMQMNTPTSKEFDDFETCSNTKPEFIMHSGGDRGRYPEAPAFNSKLPPKPSPCKGNKEYEKSCDKSFCNVNNKVPCTSKCTHSPSLDTAVVKNKTKTNDSAISVRCLSDEVSNDKPVLTDSSKEQGIKTLCRGENASRTHPVSGRMQTSNFSNCFNAKLTQKVKPLHSPNLNLMEFNTPRAKYHQKEMIDFSFTSKSSINKNVPKILNITENTVRETRQENNRKSFGSMSVSEIVQLMESQNLSKIAEVCKNNNIDGNFLVMMITKEDLSSDPFFLDSFEIKRYMWLKNGNLPKP